jgi:alkanesulfonate monooxygenase SsuD/methylene tetrahydromethanopterin reductase-like flavin-dependent oxidoreductase (luciferase family)
LWAGEKAFAGRFYAWDGLRLEPEPVQRPSPPIWIGSWGSEAGLRRTARIGDGWLASAYNTTPPEFAARLQLLNGYLESEGRDSKTFPNALATIGSAEECAEKLRGLAGVGVQRVYIWPMLDPVRQIERFREKVVPLVG